MPDRDGVRQLGWWLALLVAAGFLLPRLASWGTYVDGTLYATIARNMAEGRGASWDPFYTECIHQHFSDHPPLGLILNGQPFSAIFNLVLIVFCLVFGLIFHVLLLVPSAHALIAVHMKREDRRHREVVEAIRQHGPPPGYRS